ncbi:hypothetical protein TNCV_4658061 [Trichonephila clavipes]|nr:hypothetical protein TNCV_4658061 [Trichonephila clavipes]
MISMKVSTIRTIFESFVFAGLAATAMQISDILNSAHVGVSRKRRYKKCVSGLTLGGRERLVGGSGNKLQVACGRLEIHFYNIKRPVPEDRISLIFSMKNILLFF